MFTVIINSDKLKRVLKKYVLDNPKASDEEVENELRLLLFKLGITSTKGVVLSNPKLYLHNEAFTHDIKFNCRNLDDDTFYEITIAGYISTYEITIKSGRITKKINTELEKRNYTFGEFQLIDSNKEERLTVESREYDKINIKYQKGSNIVYDVIISKSNNGKNIIELINIGMLFRLLTGMKFSISSLLITIGVCADNKDLSDLEIKIFELNKDKDYYAFNALDIVDGTPTSAEFKVNDKLVKYTDGKWYLFDNGLRVDIYDNERIKVDYSSKSLSSDLDYFRFGIGPKIEGAASEIKRTRTRLNDLITKMKK